MSLAIVAIVAVTALLVATTAVSSLTNQAYATTRMNAAQSRGKTNAWEFK